MYIDSDLQQTATPPEKLKHTHGQQFCLLILCTFLGWTINS